MSPHQPAEHERHPDPSAGEPAVVGQADEHASGDSPFGWFLAGGVGLLVAVLCFTPIWDEVAGRSTGRRAGFTALLAGLGPIPVAAIAVVVSAVFIVIGVRARRGPR